MTQKRIPDRGLVSLVFFAQKGQIGFLFQAGVDILILVRTHAE